MSSLFLQRQIKQNKNKTQGAFCFELGQKFCSLIMRKGYASKNMGNVRGYRKFSFPTLIFQPQKAILRSLFKVSCILWGDGKFIMLSMSLPSLIIRGHSAHHAI